MTDAPANTPSPRFSRPRPRLRKAAKWGGLILSILFLGLWVASVWLDFGYLSNLRIGAGASGGRLILSGDSDSSTRENHGSGWLRTHPPFVIWSFKVRNIGPLWFVTIPLWAITLPTIALTVFAWRRDAAARRRALLNHCPTCGYDRAGLFTPDTVCPECGAAAPTAASGT